MDAKNSAVVSRRLTINDKLYEKTLVFSYIDDFPKGNHHVYKIHHNSSNRQILLILTFNIKTLQNMSQKLTFFYFTRRIVKSKRHTLPDDGELFYHQYFAYIYISTLYYYKTLLVNFIPFQLFLLDFF
jgi:hypothetical protein